MQTLKSIWLFFYEPFTQFLRFLLSHYILIACFAIAACVFSFWLDYHFFQHQHYFQRSGALLSLAGLLCSTRRLIRRDFKDYIKGEKVIDGGTPDNSETAEDIQMRHDVYAMGVGLSLLLVGTVFWAYGDLWI